MIRPRRPRVLICSPYGSDSAEWESNVSIASALCLAVLEAGGAPLAPHLHYPRFLNELSPRDRARGLECSIAWLDVADCVLVYDAKGVSAGMRQEIKAARSLGKKVQTVEDISHVDVVLGWIRRHEVS